MVTLGRPQGMKGFVLPLCDLICEPASPALSEARERQVAKSAAVMNPSRLHPTLRRDPLRSPLFFSSWGKYLLHESDCISVALLESRVCYTSGGIITATHTLLSVLYLAAA